MSDYSSVFDLAAHLPVSDRLHLIDALWETVPEMELPGLSVEWLAEIEARSAEFDAGQVTTMPWSQVRMKAMERLAAATGE